MSTSNNNASDTGLPRLRDPVADSSAANDETIDAQPGTSTDDESKWTLLVPIGRSTIGCKWCTNLGRNMEFLSLSDLDKHLQEKHSGSQMVWKCRPCQKMFDKLHGWKCHFPKCRPERKVVKEFQCTHCVDSFESQIGLSMHERHRHPVLRNLRRREIAERPHGRPGRNLTTWSEEEVALLKVLNERFGNERFPNVKIREFMPQKTLKQISDKRRGLVVDQPQQEEVIEENTGPVNNEDSASDSGSDDSDITIIEVIRHEKRAQPTQAEQPVVDMNMGEMWKESIREHIPSIIIPKESAFLQMGERIDRLVGEQIVDHEEVESILCALSKELAKEKEKEGKNEKKGNPNKSTGKKPHKAKPKIINRNRRQEFTYARCQDLYRKCPGKLADLAVDGAMPDKRQEPPQKEVIQELYDRLWGTAGPKATLPDSEDDLTETSVIMKPITVLEVAQRMSRIKANTAAGPDKIRKSHLQRPGAMQAITKMFNLLILVEYYPMMWKKNRTTLIPKVGKDPQDIKNWRPITIGSLVGRMFSGILDGRLRSVIKMTPRQKGFTSEDGCKGNVKLLDCAIAKMKAEKGGVIQIVNISKAFDTVPHTVLEKCLTRKGVSTTVAKYIKNMYRDISMTIRAKDEAEVEIGLKRGVKQGDPLSPLLFNLIIEPIIEEINEGTAGLTIGDENLAVLAFADDMVLIAKDKTTALDQIARLDNFLERLGMSLSISKCLALQFVTHHKTWHLNDPEIILRNEQMPSIAPEQIFEYLGVRRDPWLGSRQKTDVNVIVKAIENASKFALKPHQKINLIRVYILPRFIHGLVASPPAISTLDTLDHQVKQVVKRILKLPKYVTDGIIYSSKSHGGIGMPRMEHIVKLAAMRSSIKMRESADSIQRYVAHDVNTRMSTYAKSVGIEWPSTLEEIERARKNLRLEETNRWAQLISQGQGVREFRKDAIGNAWLYNPTLLKPSRYTEALKLRTNTVGTRIAMKRANPNINTQCRRCGGQLETLAHIIGACIHTKPQRIRRHNEIKDLIVNKASKRRVVFDEPTVNVVGELKKPDLVIKDQEKLYVVDVTVRYENGASLRKAAKEKMDKYSDTAELIKLQTGCVTAQVLPVVVGSRGAMPKETQANLKCLGLNKSEMITISMIALRSSLEMVNTFIDYDWTI